MITDKLSSYFILKSLECAQVTVENIHIRYEDTVCTPGRPFAVGITLRQFYMFVTRVHV